MAIKKSTKLSRANLNSVNWSNLKHQRHCSPTLICNVDSLIFFWPNSKLFTEKAIKTRVSIVRHFCAKDVCCVGIFCIHTAAVSLLIYARHSRQNAAVRLRWIRQNWTSVTNIRCESESCVSHSLANFINVRRLRTYSLLVIKIIVTSTDSPIPKLTNGYCYQKVPTLRISIW